MADGRLLRGNGTPPWEEYKTATVDEIYQRMSGVKTESETQMCKIAIMFHNRNKDRPHMWGNTIVSVLALIVAVASWLYR